ncbi:MAG: hypothetical protein AAB771_01025 [Patescibacteria group bacterium]
MKSLILLIVLIGVVFTSVYWLVEESPWRIILGDEELKTGLTVAAIFSRIKDSYNFALTKLFAKIAKIKGEDGKKDESENYFQKSEKAAAEVDEPFKKTKAFVLIAKERNEAEKVKSSETVSEEILSDLKEAAKSFGETGGFKQTAAASILGQAVAGALPFSESNKNSEIISQIISEINLTLPAAEALFYSELAFAYLKQGNLEASRDVINQISDQNSRLILFLMFTEKAAGLEDWGKGKDLIETIDIPVYRNYGNFKLMNFLFSQNKLNEAEEISKSLIGTNFEEAAVLEIAGAYLKIGEKEKALNLIQRMIK